MLGATERITVGTTISIPSAQLTGGRTARSVTRPHPPILVAFTSETTLDLAAARGLPVLIGMHIGDDEKRRLVQRWVAVAERNGHDPTAAPKAAITGVPIAVSYGELRRTSPTSTVATTQAR